MTHYLLPVADEILRLSKTEGRELTPLQLMKLSYICYGWYSATDGARLFQERIEAWRYGPVMPALYHQTKRWGRGPIPEIPDSRPTSIEKSLSVYLRAVIDRYGHLTGRQLSSLTHQKGSPWDQVYRPGVPDIEIPHDVIARYYKAKLDDYTATASTA